MPGPIGAAGLKGAEGLQGYPGKRGKRGHPGSQGDQGPAGEAGAKGQTGPVGDVGLVGILGPKGRTGQIGYVGPVGQEGITGPTGRPGPQGPQGQPGAPGSPGPPGPRRYQNTEVTSLDHSTEIYKTLHYLSNLLHSIKNPLGTRDNPARICRDLLSCERKVSDGKYWIDPNIGCPSDAIEVFCNFTAGGQTCLMPPSATKLEFSIGKVQMNFLHLLSSEATHSITVHCLNTPMWGLNEAGGQKTSVSFKGWNGQLFKANSLLEPKVLVDECMINCWIESLLRQVAYILPPHPCSQACSGLLCVKKHKLALSCNGVRDKTAFVSVTEFTDLNLLSDYRFLEDVGRTADAAARDLSVHRPTTNKFINYLRNRARRHNINLKTLPIGFTKRRENSTIFNKKLKIYAMSPRSDLQILMKIENRKQNSARVKVNKPMTMDSYYCARQLRYNELDASRSLLENLKNKVIIEYPTLFVVLKKLKNDMVVLGQEASESAEDSDSGSSSLSSEEEGEIRESS
ncbi:UNVERIFIED_CONTAM: hypothetical protein H355_004345 [Colinus virginianus]|nr:hypothetical protein H355_004345 [Colinus virginianus]